MLSDWPKISAWPSGSAEVGFTQASSVKFDELRLSEYGTATNPERPSKVNACPNRPGPNVVPPWIEPSFGPALSRASPSAFHQLRRPGAVAHPSSVTTERRMG